MGILIIVVLFLIDILSKEYIERYFCRRKVVISKILEINYIRNYGIAFNKLDGKKRLIILVNVLVLGYLIKLYILDSSLALELLLAGGFGNTVSRIIKGYVTDFIYFPLRRFPVFNIADFYIFIGAFLIVIQEIS